MIMLIGWWLSWFEIWMCGCKVSYLRMYCLRGGSIRMIDISGLC